MCGVVTSNSSDSLCNSSNWKDNDRDSGRGEHHGPIQVRQKDSEQQERRRARAGKGFKDGSGKEEQTDGSSARVYKTDRRKLRKDPMRKDKDK